MNREQLITDIIASIKTILTGVGKADAYYIVKTVARRFAMPGFY